MPTMIKDVLADQLYNSVFSVKAMYNDLMVAEYVHDVRDQNRRPEGGEWEPIKISLEIDPSAYIPKITTSPRT